MTEALEATAVSAGPVPRFSRTLPGLLARRAQSTPCAAAYEWQDCRGSRSTVEWGELSKRASRFSLGLMRLGVTPAARVAVFCEATQECLVAYFGALCAGAVVVPLPEAMRDVDLEHALEASGAAYAIAGSRNVVERLRGMAQRLPNLRRTVAWGSAACADGVLPFGQLCLNADEALTSTGSRLRVPRIRPEDPAFIVFERGLRGTVEPWTLSHGGCHFIAEALGGVLSGGALDRLVPVAAPTGFQDGVLPALACAASGTPTLFPDSGESLTAHIQRSRPSVVVLRASQLLPVVTEVVVKATGSSARPRRLHPWAMRAVAEVERRRREGIRIGLIRAASAAVADAVVHSAVREHLGGRLRAVIVLGEMERAVVDLAQSVRLPVVTVWGPAASSTVCTLGDLGSARLGSVGSAVGGSTLCVGADGALRVTGPHRAERGIVSEGFAADSEVPWPLRCDGRLGEHGWLWVERGFRPHVVAAE